MRLHQVLQSVFVGVIAVSSILAGTGSGSGRNADLVQIDLGLLVRKIMVDGGAQPSWWLLADEPELVRWTTDGIKAAGDGSLAYREGLSRLTVQGTVTRVLKQRPTEVLWSVTLGGPGSGKVPPEFVKLEPGVECSGATSPGCDFPLDGVLEAAQLTAELLCSSASLEKGEGAAVYLASPGDGRRNLLAYFSSAESGRTSNWLEVHWTDDLARAHQICDQADPSIS